jgi:recombination protein RecT
MTENVTAAVAKRDNSPLAMLGHYKQDFAVVLPSHLPVDKWVRIGQGLLRRDEKLAAAAARNPGSFMSAMLECARLGLEPGDTFHLVPIGGEIVGITDYTGEIELIYRAQAIASVKAEVVYSKDEFEYSPDMDRPRHKVDWFGDRGEMVGAYAYGVFKDGATSRVVVMNKQQIEQVKAVNKLNASNRADNPWVKWTDRMWLKTVVKQLSKWVPSSPEYLTHALKAVAAAQPTALEAPSQPLPPTTPVQPADVTHLRDGEHVVDAEIVQDGQS